MTKPTLPEDSYEQRFRKLEERIGKIERFGQLVSSSIKEGTLTILDSLDHPRVRLGKLLDGEYGIEVIAANGTGLLRMDGTGQQTPYINTAWVESSLFDVSVSSGTFADIFTTAIGVVVHEFVSAYIPVVTPAGSEAEIRVRVGGVFSPAVTVPQSTNTYVLVPGFQHSTPIGSGPGFAAIQARVSSGAGPITIQQSPLGLTWAGS